MTDEELHGGLIDRQGSRLELNTPVLVVELDALQRNIARMAAFAASKGLGLRPHAKTHKSPDIAKLQMAAGALGICCAKIGEAEVMADAGVRTGLHLTSPVASPPAIRRLAALNLRADDLSCVVDDPGVAKAIGEAAGALGKPVNVLIDIDPGAHRTGAPTLEAALALLAVIRAEPGLVYRGVQFYCGSEQHIGSYEGRRLAIEDRTALAAAVADGLTAAGGRPEIITGGGTGTHRIDAELGFLTELQVGSYVFMDSQYLACDLTGEAGAPPFETALMVDTRVVSANIPGRATVDGGLKAFATDGGAPQVLSGAGPGAIYRFMGDEHGAVLLSDGRRLTIGDRVVLAAPHCDPTVNLYDTYHVVQGDTLRALWPVAARGRSR